MEKKKSKQSVQVDESNGEKMSTTVSKEMKNVGKMSSQGKKPFFDKRSSLKHNFQSDQIMPEETEAQTRKSRIDKKLGTAGWNVNDGSKVLIEVDTKNSDFNARNYKYKSETLSEEKKAYADYVLLDSKGDPLAVIEAKKASVNPDVGQKQAEMYVDDIKKNYSKDILIYYTNGHQIWFWNKGHSNPRQLMGFHSQADLERIRFQNISAKSFSDVKVDETIVNRDYQLEAIQRVVEGINSGRRRFLLVQATGTGKTRVAMALMDILIRTNRAQRILFLTDRSELNDQAFDENIIKFFPSESKQKVHSSTVDQNSRIYASTLQTMKNNYRDFPIGFFDVIISDEAHRSIYDSYGNILDYFDATLIGLTATPTNQIEHDTYNTFDCQINTPTFSYDYEKAVPKYLAPYSVYQAQTHFQVQGIRSEELQEQEKERLLEEYGLEEDELNFTGTSLEKKVTVSGSNQSWIREFMENCIEDDTGLPAKTIIFPVSIKHAYRIKQEFEDMYPEFKGELVRVITHEDRRKKDLIKDFKKQSKPRIAISVGILDTGVDIPEVCNLVFMRPIKSAVRFWQMIGRGTRHDSICEHRDWLPGGKKNSFLIFDFFKNFEYFDLHPIGNVPSQTEAITVKIFLNRLKIYKELEKKNDTKNLEIIKNKIKNDIDSLDQESQKVQQSESNIQITKEDAFWSGVGRDPIEFLKKNISHLMKHKKNVSLSEQTFIFNCEKYLLVKLSIDSVPEWWLQPVAVKHQERIAEDVAKLPTNLEEVKPQKELVNTVLSKSFWSDTNSEDIAKLIDVIAPLMKYKRAEEQRIIEINAEDLIEERKPIIYGPDRKEEHVEVYQQKVERRVRELAESLPVIQKIKKNEELTSADLEQLEEALNAPELYITEENLKKIYQKPGEMIGFMKHILDIEKLKNPEELIEEAFRGFEINHSPAFSADQLLFLQTLQTVFERKHHIEKGDLYEFPFSNLGSNYPTPMFKEEVIDEMMIMCKKLEEVFN